MSEYQESIIKIREQVKGSYPVLMKRTGLSKPTIIRAFNADPEKPNRTRDIVISAAVKLIDEQRRANERLASKVIETAKTI